MNNKFLQIFEDFNEAVGFRQRKYGKRMPFFWETFVLQ